MIRHFFALIRRVFIFTLLLSIPASRAGTTDGLVSYWPFETIVTGDQNTTPDVAFTNPFVIVGTPVVEPGKFGNAFTMNATSYLTNLHDVDRTLTGLPIYGAGAYTIAFWVKGAPQGGKYFFAHGLSTSTAPLLILQTGTGNNTAKLDIIIRPDAGAASVDHRVSTAVILDNQWHHVAFVDNNGAAIVYIDGVADATSFVYTRSATFTFNTTAVGSLVRTTTATGNTFTGQLDDMAIWERALSADEINDVKNNSLPNPVPPHLSIVGEVSNKTLGDRATLGVYGSGIRPLTAYQWQKNDVDIPDATGISFQTDPLLFANSGDKYSVRVTTPTGDQTFSATVSVTADPAPDLRKDLVNYWPLNETETVDGLLRSKELYSGNDMVLVGFAGQNDLDLTAGQFGNALAFDGARYAYRTNGLPIYNSQNFTVSLWVNGDFNGQTDRRVFSEGSSTDVDPLFTIGTYTGTVPSASASVFIRSDNNVGTAVNGRNSVGEAFNNQWHHIVWTDANGKGKLYIDGVIDRNDHTYTRPTLTLDRTAIGAVLRAAEGNQFFGGIDEVATWKRVLTHTEIQAIMTEGVPAPVAAIPVEIITQPVPRTAGVFKGDNITFSVQTTGTLPITYEWYRNDVKIDLVANPSAATDTLRLNNVAIGDSGSTFYAKVSNSVRTVQSATVGLNVADYTPAASGTVLNVDLGQANNPSLQPGFDEFTLAMNGTNYNGVGLTLLPIGALALDSRLRTAVVDVPPDFTFARLYNDFIFANGTAADTGLRIMIERLLPNTPYGLTIWSFDSSSAGRLSNWSETSSPENPQVIATDFGFNSAVLPVANEDYTLRAVLTSSATGKLQIDGLRSASSGAGQAVFVNAIRLVANPGIQIVKTEVVDNITLRITAERLTADQVIELQQRADLSTGDWGPSTATIFEENGLTVIFDIPIITENAKMFFRVATVQPVN